jgi:ABC-type multidrug transport system ATPase subunit
MQVVPILCPACATIHRAPETACENCHLQLDWLDRFPRIRDLLIYHANSLDETGRQAAAIPKLTGVADTILLQAQIPTAIRLDEPSGGDRTSSALTPEANDFWVIPWHDSSTPEAPLPRLFVVACGQRPVFINRCSVLAAELQPGDVLELGGYGWSFSGLDLHLIPLTPMGGVGLLVDQVHIRGRLGPQLRVRIEPGQFLAVVGQSGAGKSTLLKVLAGFQGRMEAGTVRVLEPDGTAWNRSEDIQRFRQALGYVSQEAILHEDLSAQQTLTLSARLRGKTVNLASIEWTLLRAEIDRERWQNAVRNLSGGENKRLRTATELMGEPHLLLLDEPDSGLDERRRLALLRFLRTLSWQGCTVVLVTHHTSHLTDYCDRIFEIDQRQISRDRLITADSSSTLASLPAVFTASRQARAGKLWQSVSLAHRELLLIAGAPLRRVLLPTGVAVLFAIAISVATTPTGTAMLGFLAIISVLWMSASLSLLAIVGERAVFDHERRLFLSVPGYLIAKVLVYAVLSCCQTVVFVLVLWMTRSALNRQCLHHPIQTCLTLCLVGLAGVSLGSLISALARTRKETATALLPLVMVAQIVFSVPIAINNGTDNTVKKAYDEFHVHRCSCGQYATEHVFLDGNWRWLCTNCRNQSQMTWAGSTPKSTVSGDHGMNPSTLREPTRWAALASYATISRPADIALRSFSYFGNERFDQDLERPMAEAITGLLIWAICLLVATSFVLALQHQRFTG